MGNKWRVILIAAIFIFGGTFLLHWRHNIMPRRPSAPQLIPPQDWAEHSPDHAVYRILMPGIPKQRQEPTPWGQQATTYELDRDEVPARFIIFAFDLPPNIRAQVTPEKFMDAICEGIAREDQAKILQNKAIQVDGHPARHCLMKSGQIVVTRFQVLRICFTGRSVIVAGVSIPETQIHADFVRRYLESLKVVR